MRIWVRYSRQDSAMRAIYRGIRRRAHELGGLEIRLWTPSHPRFLTSGGWRPDGMILIGRSSKAERDRDLLQIPAVHVDLTMNSLRREEPPPGWPSLGLDEAAIGRKAACYLHGLGLKRLCLINQGWRGPQGPRSHAFLSKAKLLGTSAVDLCSACGHRAFDEDESGPRRMIDYLRDLPRPFGIYATSDALAELAMDYCHLAGVDIPREAAIIGTGDDPLHAPDASVSLSSVHLPLFKLGGAATDHLATILKRHGHPAAQRAVDRIDTPEQGELPPPLPPLGITVRTSTSLTYSGDELASEASQLIAADRDNSLTVDGLAQRLGVSTATLFRHCRTAWSCSPSQYLQRVRIHRAQRLLRDQPQISLSNVALHCGFSDQAAFTRAFRRVCGCTPGSYRVG